MGTFSVNIGPFDNRGEARAALLAPAVGILLRDQGGGIVPAAGYVVEYPDGFLESPMDGKSGAWAAVVVDDAVAVNWAAASAALGSLLMPTGQSPTRILGIAPRTVDVPQRIRDIRDRKLANNGFRVPGPPVRWYPSDADFVARLGVWAGLAARMTDAEFDALALRVEDLEGRAPVLTRAMVLTLATECAKTADLYRTRARLAITAQAADPAGFRISSIVWPAGFGE